MTSHFFWVHLSKGRKIHWVSWQSMCPPKSHGGPGFSDLEIFNRALMAKQGWRILFNSESLVARVLKGKYFNFGDFLNARSGSNPSYLWPNLLWGRDLLSRGIRWRIGNGIYVRIFDDPWIPFPARFRPISLRLASSSYLVAELINSTGGWNVNAISSSLLLDVDIILSIPLCPSSLEDSLLWHFDSKGLFSVKSCYHLGFSLAHADAASLSDSQRYVRNNLWAARVPRKILIFMCQFFQNALPSFVNLWR